MAEWAKVGDQRLFVAGVTRVICVNAGHPPPFVIKGNEVQTLEATGLILGALPEITLHRSYARIEPGSMLFLYSDGLFEREDEDEEIFDLPRLKELAIRHQEKDATDMIDAIFRDLDEFGKRTKWEDDSTLVVIKRLA